MITIDAKVNLIDKYFLGEKITDKLLINCGFTKEDITSLIEKKIIQPKNIKSLFVKEEYDLDVNEIIFTIKVLFDLKRNDKAYIYLKSLYDQGIKNKFIISKLILNEINNKNYNITSLLDDLMICEDGKYRNDANFYLLLLSNIIELKEEYIEIVKNLTFNDIKSSLINDDYNRLRTINNVRGLCLNQKYVVAFSIYKNYIDKINDCSTNARITRSLLFHVLHLKDIFSNKLLKYTKDKNYEAIIELLEKENDRRNLRESEIQIITLCRSILEIDKSNKLPYTYYTGTGNTFFSIDRSDYETALKCAEYEIKRFNLKEKDRIIYYLLEDINNLINEIKILNKKIISILDKYFEGNDEVLDNYLKEIKAEKYKEVIIKLLIISNYKFEINYDTTLFVLVGLTRKQNSFNYKEFILLYEKALKAKDEYLAKLYYDVIKDANKLNPSMENQVLINNYLEEHKYVQTSFVKELKYENKS